LKQERCNLSAIERKLWKKTWDEVEMFALLWILLGRFKMQCFYFHCYFGREYSHFLLDFRAAGLFEAIDVIMIPELSSK
jgi:hypothetical protein